MAGWMDEWMDDWMDGWMNGWMDGWMDGWMGGLNGRMGEQMVYCNNQESVAGGNLLCSSSESSEFRRNQAGKFVLVHRNDTEQHNTMFTAPIA